VTICVALLTDKRLRVTTTRQDSDATTMRLELAGD